MLRLIFQGLGREGKREGSRAGGRACDKERGMRGLNMQDYCLDFRVHSAWCRVRLPGVSWLSEFSGTLVHFVVVNFKLTFKVCGVVLED